MHLPDTRPCLHSPTPVHHPSCASALISNMFAQTPRPHSPIRASRSPSPSRKQRLEPGGTGTTTRRLGDGKVSEGKRLFEDLARRAGTPKVKSESSTSTSASTSLKGAGMLGDKTNRGGRSSSKDGEEQGGSPSKSRSASPTKLGASSNTTIRALQTPAKSSNQSNSNSTTVFETPAAQTGKAGAARARMAEALEARQPIKEVEEEEEEGGSIAAKQSAFAWPADDAPDDAWPEIEYMPAPVEIAHSLPFELDGLPRADELARSLCSMRFGGFVREVELEDARNLALLQDQEAPWLVPTRKSKMSEQDLPWPNRKLAAANLPKPAPKQTTIAIRSARASRSNAGASSSSKVKEASNATARTASNASKLITTKGLVSRGASLTTKPTTTTAVVASLRTSSITPRAAPTKGMSLGKFSAPSSRHAANVPSPCKPAPREEQNRPDEALHADLSDFMNDQHARWVDEKLRETSMNAQEGLLEV
ncbi:hypothetical protein IE81DRAFT_327261 [Ceraceosorus guamensis]|uniref:Uncharacterized protein n=1 Tax=Ceraceosorus guamensis TaxID=1522189 RepID=A0A316VM71_9BASI|nr:hypothetical protein IE81DRAFT_327261 [Ceraceosorus guamensis]PWN38666.1 hypothetical protein IE81DRAFT_327261 [Ceraceosorus guamensis]